MPPLLLVLVSVVLGMSGCAARPAAPTGPADQVAPLPRDVVARAATSLHLRTDDGDLHGTAMTEFLASARVTCVGESHTDPEHHYAQWRVITELGALSRARSERFGVGLEMFERAQQRHLDSYSPTADDDAAFVEQSGYRERWGFDFSLYRPLLDEAVSQGGALLALNAPKAWTRAVAKAGLAQVDPGLRAQFPELLLDDPEHRAFFAAAMAGHPGSPPHRGKVETEQRRDEHSTAADAFPPALESYYAAQVVWDETMAETASRWFSHAPSSSRLVIIAGNGHCHRSAIPKRLARRLGQPVLSLRPIRERELDAPQVPNLGQFDALIVLR
jgi:uncharacterized iron-regulated protein